MLIDQIKSDIVVAMKARDTMKVELLKTIKGEVERDPNKSTTNETVLKILKKMKDGLVAINSSELERETEILDAYMPRALTIEEMDIIVEACIVLPTGKPTMKDFGPLMKIIQARAGTRGDMKYISTKLKEVLT